MNIYVFTMHFQRLNILISAFCDVQIHYINIV